MMQGGASRDGAVATKAIPPDFGAVACAPRTELGAFLRHAAVESEKWTRNAIHVETFMFTEPGKSYIDDDFVDVEEIFVRCQVLLLQKYLIDVDQ